MTEHGSEDRAADVVVEVQATAPAVAPADAAAMRELVLKAHPDVVPELVQGESISELLGSVPTAQAAYQRIVDQARAAAAAAAPAPAPAPSGIAVAPGASVRSVPVDPTGMSPAEMIRRGLDRG